MTAPAAAPTKPPAGLIWAGVISMVLGTIIGIGMFVLGVVSIANSISDLDTNQMSVPGKQKFQLDAGDMVVYSRAGTLFDSSDVTVTGPNGNEIPVRDVFGTQSLSNNGVTYYAQAKFEAPTRGSYEVEIDSFGSGKAAVGPDFVTGLGGGAILIGLSFVVGGVLFTVGLILLIVGLVKRSNAKKRSNPPTYGGGYGSPPQPTYGGVPGYGTPPPAPGGYQQPGPYQQPGGYQQPGPG